MSLENELKKLTVAVVELTAKIEGGAATTQAPAATPAVEVPTTAPAADPLADIGGPGPAAVEVAAPAATPAAPAAAPADGAADKKSVTQAAIALGKAKGSAVLRQVLAEFGAENVSGIKPEQFAAAQQKLQAALA